MGGKAVSIIVRIVEKIGHVYAAIAHGRVCGGVSDAGTERMTTKKEDEFMRYTVQTWKQQARIHDDISGLSIDAAREIARAHAMLGYVGRIMADDKDYCEVYLDDEIWTGTFAQTTRVFGIRAVMRKAPFCAGSPILDQFVERSRRAHPVRPNETKRE